jgi:hypothetical protein
VLHDAAAREPVGGHRADHRRTVAAAARESCARWQPRYAAQNAAITWRLAEVVTCHSSLVPGSGAERPSLAWYGAYGAAWRTSPKATWGSLLVTPRRTKSEYTEAISWRLRRPRALYQDETWVPVATIA